MHRLLESIMRPCAFHVLHLCFPVASLLCIARAVQGTHPPRPGNFFFSGADASAQRATLRFSKRSRAKSKGRLDGDLVSGDWSGDRTLGSPRGTPGVKYTCDELLCLTTSDAPRRCSKTNTAPSTAPLWVFGQTVACSGALKNILFLP